MKQERVFEQIITRALNRKSKEVYFYKIRAVLLAAASQALVGTLEMELETEKQGRASAQDALIETSGCGTRRSFVFVCQEAFGKVKDSANSLECQLASACATAERLKVPWGDEF